MLTLNRFYIIMLIWVLSSMDKIRCFELRDVGSIPAGPASERVNTISDNSRKGVYDGCSSTRYFRSSKTMDLTR